MRHCLAAWTHVTATTPPAYVSINVEDEGISITVRGPATGFGGQGPYAATTLTEAEFTGLLKELNGRWAKLLRDRRNG